MGQTGYQLVPVFEYDTADVFLDDETVAESFVTPEAADSIAIDVPEQMATAALEEKVASLASVILSEQKEIREILNAHAESGWCLAIVHQIGDRRLIFFFQRVAGYRAIPFEVPFQAVLPVGAKLS